MYGNHVHNAVIAARETESGISIHLVNEAYDEGRILAQHRCPVSYNDTAHTLAEKIHILEQKHFPAAIRELVKSLNV